MARPKKRYILLFVVLAGSAWVYRWAHPPDPALIPPRVSETDSSARLAALRKLPAELLQRPELELESVEIQHLLISFLDPEGLLGIEGMTRSQADAEQLAAELFSQARAGEDFDDLVIEHTDDSAPGIFLLARDPSLLKPDEAADAIARADFVPAIGDVAWRLEVGEISVAVFDPERSYLGWHLIKRLR